MHYPFFNSDSTTPYIINDDNKTVGDIIISVCRTEDVDWDYMYLDPCSLVLECFPLQLDEEPTEFLNQPTSPERLGTDEN